MLLKDWWIVRGVFQVPNFLLQLSPLLIVITKKFWHLRERNPKYRSVPIHSQHNFETFKGNLKHIREMCKGKKTQYQYAWIWSLMDEIQKKENKYTFRVICEVTISSPYLWAWFQTPIPSFSNNICKVRRNWWKN